MLVNTGIGPRVALFCLAFCSVRSAIIKSETSYSEEVPVNTHDVQSIKAEISVSELDESPEPTFQDFADRINKLIRVLGKQIHHLQGKKHTTDPEVTLVVLPPIYSDGEKQDAPESKPPNVDSNSPTDVSDKKVIANSDSTDITQDDDDKNSRPYPVKHLRIRRDDDSGGQKVGALGTGAKNNGSTANAMSQTGKAAATAMSKTGDAKATALNGSQANAMALSAHENGDAKATADTHGEGGSKASSMARGMGNATASGISRGTGESQATSIAAKGGSARADSDAREGGNSTANSIAAGKGVATSDSLSRKGSSGSAAITKGTGDAKANSVAGGEDGKSRSLATSHGGNVVSNSRTLGKGGSHSIGSTEGEGTSISNSVAKEGSAQADSMSENGASVANAMNGEGDMEEFGKSALELDDDDIEAGENRARK